LRGMLKSKLINIRTETLNQVQGDNLVLSDNSRQGDNLVLSDNSRQGNSLVQGDSASLNLKKAGRIQE